MCPGWGRSDSDAVSSSTLREVFPLLQRAHGSSVRLSERQQLHGLVQDPHLLQRHIGKGCRDRLSRGGGRGVPFTPSDPPVCCVLPTGCLCEDHTPRGHQVPVERAPPHAVSVGLGGGTPTLSPPPGLPSLPFSSQGDGCASHSHLFHHLRPAAGLPARPHREPGPPHPIAGGGSRPA